MFPEIDTSYWQVKDKEWVLERKAQWALIEPMLKGYKSGKGKTAIKQYFLKGKMPDWEKFRFWNSTERHVDLFMFLWLHPSRDETVLAALRDEYIGSELIVYDDVAEGMRIFFSSSIISASQDYTGRDEEFPYILYTGENELLFKLLMSDLQTTHYHLDTLTQGFNRDKRAYPLSVALFDYLCLASVWLCNKTMQPINHDMLLQYDLPLEWWYSSVKNVDYFKRPYNRKTLPQYERALWRFYNFDIEKEGDTCRTRFVLKINRILDERDFFAVEIKDIWERVKRNEISPERPWDRSCRT